MKEHFSVLNKFKTRANPMKSLLMSYYDFYHVAGIRGIFRTLISTMQFFWNKMLMSFFSFIAR